MRIDIFDLGQRVRRYHVLQHHHVPRLLHGKIGLRSDDHPKRLHIADCLDVPGAMIQHNFAEIHRSSLRRNGP